MTEEEIVEDDNIEEPEGPPEPSSQVTGANEEPVQTVQEGRPTHLLTRGDGSTEAVWPEGFSEDADLTELPAGHWDDEDAAILASIEAALLAEVDRQAGECRCRFYADVPGQMATDLDKERHALAFLGDGAPADYSRITAEAAVRGITEQAMAELVLASVAEWRALDTAIEIKRVETRLAIGAAADAEAKRAAAVVDWEAL